MRPALPGLVLSFLSLTASAQDLLPELEVVGRRTRPGRLETRGYGATTVVGSDRLREAAETSVADILRAEAGLNFTSFFGGAGAGAPQLRGFGENASSRVLILLDGLPMNRPDLANPVWFEFPLAGLERVELAPGSRNVRYGSAALAGVIALESRREVKEAEWHGQASRGSWDTSLLRLNGLFPAGRGWTSGIALDLYESDGWRENSGTQSEALQWTIASPADRPWQWQASVSGSRTALENPGGLGTSAYQEDPQQSLFTRFGLADQYHNELTSRRVTQQLRYRPDPGQRWQLNASWSGRTRELNMGLGSHSDHDLDSFAFDLSHEWTHGKFSGSWGVRGAHDTLFLERFRDDERRQRFATADLTRSSLGVFGRANAKFSREWTLSGGVSGDHYDLEASALDENAPQDPLLSFREGRHDRAWAAELSLDYRPDLSRRFWLRYDRTFRFPVLDEVAGYQGFLLQTPVNSSLGPETGHAVELGGSYEKGPWQVSLTAFSHWLNGEILFDAGENLNANLARTHRVGVESRLSYRGDGWQALLNYTWTRARFLEGPFAGGSIPLVPDHQVGGRIVREIGEDFELQLEWEALSDAPEGGDLRNRNPELPGRSLFHLEGRYSLNEDWGLFGRVDNLLDERWASLKFLGQWYPGNGRGFTIGMRGKF